MAVARSVLVKYVDDRQIDVCGFWRAFKDFVCAEMQRFKVLLPFTEALNHYKTGIRALEPNARQQFAVGSIGETVFTKRKSARRGSRESPSPGQYWIRNNNGGSTNTCSNDFLFSDRQDTISTSMGFSLCLDQRQLTRCRHHLLWHLFICLRGANQCRKPCRVAKLFLYRAILRSKLAQNIRAGLFA